MVGWNQSILALLNKVDSVLFISVGCRTVLAACWIGEDVTYTIEVESLIWLLNFWIKWEFGYRLCSLYTIEVESLLWLFNLRIKWREFRFLFCSLYTTQLKSRWLCLLNLWIKWELWYLFCSLYTTKEESLLWLFKFWIKCEFLHLLFYFIYFRR